MRNQTFSLYSSRIIKDDGNIVTIEETYRPDHDGMLVLINAKPDAVEARSITYEASRG